MSIPVIILGAGGHSKVLIEALQRMGRQIEGIATPEKLPNNLFEDIPIIGDDDLVLTLPTSEFQLVNGLGSTGVLGRRKSLFEKFKSRNFNFATVIHPSAVLPRNLVLSEGVQIMAGVVIQPGSRIGKNTIINTRSSVDHDCQIGDHVHIAPGVTLSGGVSVEDCSHIGTGANVIQGIRVGKNSLVGAGTLVIRSVSELQMVTGVPAKLVKTMKNWRKSLVLPNATIRETIRIIDSEALRIALIIEGDDVLTGTVTDGDIRRGILRGISLEDPVRVVMNTNPIVAHEEDSGERILALMKNKSVQQIPVVDNQGRIIRLELLEDLFHTKLL
ncbi:MAG: NeuD/PglB/VioB family sugar acetyltransferase [Candidatus Riflebacteria bacterium]|nr:NeuD/PglB/VioB family sugar acetyltransferase [Candidatus Riflebacteria bacterium]